MKWLPQSGKRRLRLFIFYIVVTFLLILLEVTRSRVIYKTSVERNDYMDIDKHQEYKKYSPSEIEKYIINHLDELGFGSPNNPRSCKVWDNQNATNPKIHGGLIWYSENLEGYAKALKNFLPLNIDILKHIQKDNSHVVCNKLKLHPDGLMGLFPSDQLSHTHSGYIEPLTPPLRSQKYCLARKYLMSIDYLVHDFETMCHNLKTTSKMVFIDMGADLNFKGAVGGRAPTLNLWDQYETFGFHFDHIYAFEITPTPGQRVYEQILPEKYFTSYHWINAGVSDKEGYKMNPLHSILQKFSEDDMIVVKLDIDTPSVELPLMKQLLEGGPDGIYHRLIDQFYFEHHVHVGEMKNVWTGMEGTLRDSLEMFYDLRKKGIPAHYWP